MPNGCVIERCLSRESPRASSVQDNLAHLPRWSASDFRRYLLLKERKNVNVPGEHHTMQDTTLFGDENSVKTNFQVRRVSIQFNHCSAVCAQASNLITLSACNSSIRKYL